MANKQAAPKETKRLGNITAQQKEILVEYLKKHPQLLTGKFSQNFTKNKAQDMWKDLTVILNSLGGARKEWFQWRKTWHDMRSHTKTKKAAITKHRRATGGGSPPHEEDNLTQTEEAIVEILGPTVIEGDQEVNEPKVAFDLNSGFEYITVTFEDEGPGSSGLSKENISPNVCANSDLRSGTLNGTKPQSVKTGQPKPTQSNTLKSPLSKTPSKRVQRLQHTDVGASERLATQQERHLEILSNYYKRKLELMEEDIAIKRDIGESLNMICSHLLANVPLNGNSSNNSEH